MSYMMYIISSARPTSRFVLLHLYLEVKMYMSVLVISNVLGNKIFNDGIIVHMYLKSIECNYLSHDVGNSSTSGELFYFDPGLIQCV